jgi:deoxyribonuclease-4
MSCCQENKSCNHQTQKKFKNLSPIGISANWNGNAINTLKCCEVIKCGSCQIHPNNILVSKNKIQEKIELNEYLTTKKICMVVHAPLWINLANPETKNKSRAVLQNQYLEIQDLPGILNFHIGQNGTLENVAEAINSIAPRAGKAEGYETQLVAEVSAGTGNQLGKNFEELRKLYEAIDKKNYMGICYDTQHGFGAGMCDYQGHESIVKLFDNLEESANVKLIHLNDSKVEYKSLVDRHAGIGKGHIWGQNDESLRSLLQRVVEAEIPTVLETGSSQLNDIKKIRGYFEE